VNSALHTNIFDNNNTTMNDDRNNINNNDGNNTVQLVRITASEI